MITINGKEFRNLVEQVQKNQEDIAKHYDIEQTLADWGIKVIGRLDEWPEVPPAGSYVFGDAYAVGPEGGPFDFYIWTRRSSTDDEGYWLNYGPISIVGPQGPQGEPGPQGPEGKASRWFVGPGEPTGDVHENDMWLRVNSDGSTSGFVYQYRAGGWALFTSILGPQGIQGPEGKAGKQGPMGPTGPQGPAGNPSPVINIIAELPEGTVISDIYNPASVASNSGVLMPVGGVNHLWIIINGIWTDSGSWGQGGTRVYVGGQEVVEFNADTKVDKITGKGSAQRVYAINTDGSQTVLPVGSSLGAIPRYSGSTSGTIQYDGYLLTHTPTNPYHCANKQYVDTTIARSIEAIHGEIQHANVIWYTGREIVYFTLNVGILKDSILSAGDLTGWGGDLYFYGVGGLVYVNGGWVDNDSVINRLHIRCDTGEVEIESKYGASETYTALTNFSLNEAEIDQSGNIEFSMTMGSGLGGGAFMFNSIPG